MQFSTGLIVAAILAGKLLTAEAVTASFDDLSDPPATESSRGLSFANGGSLLYQGITWDERFKVVGDDYRVDSGIPGGPFYGIPHSGHYFVTSERDDPDNDRLLITTPMLLTGAWFGRNAYYGFDAGGADQITIRALSGSQVLKSVVFNLPDPFPGKPAPLQFVDTSAFAALSGITGYRIDRQALGDKNGHWVADDFGFVAVSPVPEPVSAWMWLGGLVLLARGLRRRRG